VLDQSSTPHIPNNSVEAESTIAKATPVGLPEIANAC
jgi:hypothetical protein